MDRRTFLAALGALAIGAWRRPRLRLPFTPELNLVGRYPFSLPELPYPYEALEAAIDAQTMKVHHQGHHAAYVNNLNRALEALPDWQGESLEGLLTKLEKIPSAQRTAVRNNGGGHWNHTFFWPLLAPKPQEPSLALQKRIADAFGSWAAFRGQLLDAGMRVFGSGWVWLVKTPTGQLQITTTPNQDNPLMPYAEVQGTPVLGIDVWEHAYYLKYQNRRIEYLAAVWQIISWDKVEQLLG